MAGGTVWVEADAALRRTFELHSFADAVAFVNRVAELAERENHHPDIALNYKTVTISWTTHSAGAVTDRDRDCAAETDDLFAAAGH